MSQQSADAPVIYTDFARLGAWRKDAIALGSIERLTQQLGHVPTEGERVLLREDFNFEAYAQLALGELASHSVWFGMIELETVTELDAAEVVEQFWTTRSRQK